MPDRTSDAYRQAVSDFYISLAAGETDELLFAYNKMRSVAEQYPREAAARANLGVFALRQGNLELASDHLERARETAPGHPDILYLSGLLESREGNLENAIGYFREAAASNPQSTLFRYALVAELEREDDTGNAAEILELLEQMHLDYPDNLAILYELIRTAIKQQESALTNARLDELAEQSASWPENIQAQLESVRRLAREEAFQALTPELAFLRNGLDELESFRNDFSELISDPSSVGYLISSFTWLPEPEPVSAEPDVDMRFTDVRPDSLPSSASYLRSVVMDRESVPKAIYVSDNRVALSENQSFRFPGGASPLPMPPNAIAELDYNYDFRNDYLFAGPGGLAFFRQNEDQSFTDVTGSLNLPEALLTQPWFGAWRADLDQDGDLDLVLSPQGGSPRFLRNNGDDTFAPVTLFSGLAPIRDFIMADLDADGSPEAVFLEENGAIHVYRNLRSGNWRLDESMPLSERALALTVADLNADSYLDLIVLTESEIIRTGLTGDEGGRQRETVVRLPAGGTDTPENPGLFVADMDNNGRLDLIMTHRAESRLWLGNDSGIYQLLDQQLPGRIYALFDIDGNERLDMMGITGQGEPFQLINSGTRDYGTLSLRALASGSEGDRRINSFGIGGEMEIRSGLFYQKQLITSPIVHFGLGTHTEAQMLRTVWPNGSVQADFSELGMGSTIFNEQILKGSCPWLFAFDGNKMQFVTDILWRSPLGLRINATETAGVAQTLDRVKVPAGMLKAENGVYDLRITAELWETHFFDYTSLVAVDHPEGTEVFIDERFALPVPDLTSRVMNAPNPVARVTDHHGNDVTSQIRTKDGEYLKTFDKTRYQGLVEDHYIEIELGDEAPTGRPLWLVASGWLRPTDSSINLALSQGNVEPPKGLRIDVSDGKGGWTRLHTDYGFPAGKLKTILVDLENAFADPSDRRVRFHTTSEIYWDAIKWAEGVPNVNITERPLEPVAMELRYRGYSDWNRATPASPMLPDYSLVSGTAPRWRNLVGYHTRFGDVSELMKEIDDRYVIMNAGDELVLQFEEPDAPDPGWTRSFIFVSDGWEKDGDYNTGASKTVLPLPYHGQQEYASGSNMKPDGSLKDDPVYRRFRDDWINYHTRYITPEPFQYALFYNR